MTAAERARRAWLDHLRAALIDAAGAAACAGLIDTAHQINAIALDIERKTCYTDARQRRQARKNEEENTMKNDFTLLDGSTIKIVSLGRDDGAEIIGRDTAGEIVCYIATENTTQDRAAIVQAIKDGAQTLAEVFDMWENGLGGSPFDLDYLPENYN